MTARPPLLLTHDRRPTSRSTASRAFSNSRSPREPPTSQGYRPEHGLQGRLSPIGGPAVHRRLRIAARQQFPDQLLPVHQKQLKRENALFRGGRRTVPFRKVAWPCLTSGPPFVTLRTWKRTLSASAYWPTPRRAKSDFPSVSLSVDQSSKTAPFRWAVIRNFTRCKR